MSTVKAKPKARGTSADLETPPLDAKPSIWQRWKKPLLRTMGIVLLLSIAIGAWAKISFDRIEQQALKLNATGVSLNAFLKQYTDAVKTKDVAAIVALHASGYQGKSDGFWSEELQTERDSARVLQWTSDNPGQFTEEDLRKQTEDHFSRLGEIEKGKFKISSISDLSDDAAKIKAILWIRGTTPDAQKRESRAWFNLDLRKKGKDDWEIKDKELIFGQTVLGAGKGFQNVTHQAGIDYRASHNPMLEEAEWLPSKFGIMKYSSGAVCTGDYDGDGWIDVIFADGGCMRLYRNTGDGNFEDVTSQAGLPIDIKASTCALLTDLDNDADKDLLICRSTGNNFLFENRGDGTFQDVTEDSGVQGVWVATGSACDYDNDGLVDFYLGRYLDPRKNLPTTSFYTRNGEGNVLLHNDGDLHFTDVTDEAGVREGGLTLGIAWGDYDEDGYQDVYVANDFGRNALLRNNGDGTFSDVSVESGTVNIGYGMSSQFADIDNDGDLDIYVAAVHSGQRWFGNSATLYRYLLSSVQEGTIWQDYSTFSELYSFLGDNWSNLGEEALKGNTLMLNNGDGTFRDVTEETHTNPHGWYWSSCMFDFDNDTKQDIYTVNGWITGKKPDDL